MPEDTKEYQDLFRELDSYEKQGVCMELEGKPASPTQIVRAHMIREEPGYMRGLCTERERRRESAVL